MTFIGCGAQPKNTTASLRRTARSTAASMPASLDSTSWNLPRPNWFLEIIALIWVLAPEPGSMP
ncbi:hypothetical protein D3C84_954750 [compost metagenome]